jgi:carbon-monoxide dehydrogenase medium subunit
MTRQRALERDEGIRERFPLLVEATKLIAHVAIRTRGTVGGSLAHADPAAELPAAATVLDARFLVRTTDGRRRSVPAPEFFVGPFTTALGPGELLEAVELDAPPARAGCAFVELTRVHGAFALVGVAALVELGDRGALARVRVALCGVGGTPYAPEWLDEVASGEQPSEELFDAVGRRVAGSVEPGGDAHAGPEYRRRLAGVLTRRALILATQRAALV